MEGGGGGGHHPQFVRKNIESTTSVLLDTGPHRYTNCVAQMGGGIFLWRSEERELLLQENHRQHIPSSVSDMPKEAARALGRKFALPEPRDT